MADLAESPHVTDKPKKRKVLGRKSDELKKKRLSGHITGPDCKCSRYKCFDVISFEERITLIDSFNELISKDEQDSFLATCITIKDIQRRRPRDDSKTAMPNDSSFHYTVVVVKNDTPQTVPVCVKGLCSIFGVTERRLRTVKDSLRKTGFPPKDQRGRHGNRPHKISDEHKQTIIEHIQSFRGRQSHYSREKTRRLYLPETLNISKMFALFREAHPNESLSYETYRTVFNGNFNISFGYPRADTCSTCDEISAKLKPIEDTLAQAENDTQALQEKAKLLADRELHQRKAETFYVRKRAAKERAKTDMETLAFAFDFQQELQLPNHSTNDVFYRRQLSLHSFNIHELAGDNVYIYAYDETIGKRGSDDVASMLSHFISQYIPDGVKHLELFCDSCGGQNKNYTIFRFLYAQVHFWKRFETIKISFPIRGHSYMECDRDFRLINKKLPAERPGDWFAEFRSARARPSPYNVVEMTQEDFFNFSALLKPKFKAVCPVPSRPIRELLVRRESPGLIFHRANWHGVMESAVIIPRTKNRANILEIGRPTPLYSELIPISEAKFKDLQVLKRFCNPNNHPFYDNIPNTGSAEDFHDETSSDSDSDS